MSATRSTRNFNPTNQRFHDGSAVGRAVDYLQGLGQVIPCDADGVYRPRFIDGRPNPRSNFWRRGGSTIYTDAELIACAEWNKRRDAERRAAPGGTQAYG